MFAYILLPFHIIITWNVKSLFLFAFFVRRYGKIEEEVRKFEKNYEVFISSGFFSGIAYGVSSFFINFDDGEISRLFCIV